MPTENPILLTLGDIYYALKSQEWMDADLFLETFQAGKEVLSTESDQFVEIIEKILTNQLIRDVTAYRQDSFYNWFEAIRNVKLYTNRERKTYNAKYAKARTVA